MSLDKRCVPFEANTFLLVALGRIIILLELTQPTQALAETANSRIRKKEKFFVIFIIGKALPES